MVLNQNLTAQEEAVVEAQIVIAVDPTATVAMRMVGGADEVVCMVKAVQVVIVTAPIVTETVDLVLVKLAVGTIVVLDHGTVHLAETITRRPRIVTVNDHLAFHLFLISSSSCFTHYVTLAPTFNMMLLRVCLSRQSRVPTNHI